MQATALGPSEVEQLWRGFSEIGDLEECVIETTDEILRSRLKR
jgi:hypothetical protein